MLYGARYSLVIGLSSIVFALIVGSLIGALAAVTRTWISELIMRVIDVFMSVPASRSPPCSSRSSASR